MSTCDGSADFVSFDIDPDLHSFRGARNDGDTPKNEDGGFD
jgi:hypothetical protein